MARISFTSEMAELVGKLAGSVFQYSYGGFQVHGRVVPANPQTERQQLRRGWFGWFAASWRNLTSLEQATFNTAAGSQPEGFRLFVGSNINLYLIGLPTLTSYVTSPAPASMALDIDALAPGQFDVIAAGSPAVVPVDSSLLLFATAEKVLPKRFTNPSEYSPIAVFPAGSDFTSAVSVLAEWQALYGILSGSERICINSVLISTLNGTRSADSIICKPPVNPITYYIADSTGDVLIDSDGTFITSQ